MTDREKLLSTARKILIPAMNAAAENFFERKPYTVTDQVGYSLTVMEAVFRPLWGAGPILSDLTLTVSGKRIPAADVIRKIMLIGTDTEDDRCFSKDAVRDPADFANQGVTEIAGYAVALYFARDLLWDPYSDAEKDRVGAWLSEWAKFALHVSWENNHFWFPLIVITALERLGIGAEGVDDDVKRAFSVLDSMYISDGWYQDGTFGRFDYYLAWSHHVYPLLWSMMAKGTRFYDPERTERYKKRTESFVPYYLCFFDRNGSVPAMGRSLSYRFAESAIFPAAALAGCDIPNGVCRRAMMKNVEYFTEKTPGEGNVLTPGYLYPSSPLADSYTSELGSLWCSKTFSALALPDDHPFWTDGDALLPSEKGEYAVRSAPERIHIDVYSDEDSGVTLYNNTSSYFGGYFGHTFGDMAALYCKFAYNSRAGFAISIPDKVAADSMISLLTPDFTMGSHRREFSDLGRDGDALFSSHVPFSNDPLTTVRTWLLPIKGSLHVRAHKVTLSRPYRIREGGYPIGVFDDAYSFEDGVMRYRGAFSAIRTVSSVPVRYRLETHCPERHILAPQSRYPVYETDELDAGEYFFASVFSYSEGRIEPLPSLSLKDGVVRIDGGGIISEIKLK
ncbi:MAG: DUF2264 domain-containing protein [Clostridia bacterium]|nr:DUF2264 domain-containing protein [Clostridia bacterium]